MLIVSGGLSKKTGEGLSDGHALGLGVRWTTQDDRAVGIRLDWLGHDLDGYNNYDDTTHVGRGSVSRIRSVLLARRQLAAPPSNAYLGLSGGLELRRVAYRYTERDGAESTLDDDVSQWDVGIVVAPEVGVTFGTRVPVGLQIDTPLTLHRRKRVKYRRLEGEPATTFEVNVRLVFELPL